MLVKNKRDIEDIFEKQLKRLDTDYIDYYLAHSLTSYADLKRLMEKGYGDFIEAERARGRILHTGFSFHGNTHDFKLIADAYPWQICIIQYNYLDEHNQAGVDGLDYATGKGIGVVAMEPLRGGLLGNRLPRAARRLYDQNIGASGCKSPAELAMRWVWSHPGVTCLLSGMGEEQFVEGNCRTVFALGAFAGSGQAEANAVCDGASPANTASDEASPESTASEEASPASTGPIKAAPYGTPGGCTGDILMPVPLTDAEVNTIDAIRRHFDVSLRVQCTSCAYCMPCPNGVDIPTCFYWYNIRNEFFSKIHYIVATEGAVNNSPSKASLCTGCRACERRCPQNMEISKHMKEAARKLEKAWLRVPVRFMLRAMSNSRQKP